MDGGAFNYKTAGRLAGLCYLVVVVTGMFSLLYVWKALIDMNDAAGTAAALAAGEPLFRLGIAAGIVCQSAFLILPVLLYRLFERSGRVLAMLMLVIAAASVPISFVNISHQMAILPLLGEAGAQAQIMEQLSAYKAGLSIVTVFWGLWLLPYGLLVLKSCAIPRLFGVFLILGCAGYLVDFFGDLLIDGYDDLPFIQFVSLPSAVGEIGSCLWLLIMGARAPR